MTDKQSIDKLVKQASQLEQHQTLEKVDLTKLKEKTTVTKPPLEHEWLNLAQDWQQQPFNKIDLAKLTKKTARRILKTKLIFAFDLIATIAIVIAFFTMWLFADFDNATLLYIGFAALVTPIYMLLSFKVHINSWRIGVGTPNSAIAASISACKSSIQYLQLIKYSALVYIIPINWYVYTLKQAQDKPMLMGLLLANSILLLSYAITVKMQQKRQKELVILKGLG
ncbi:MAG: hypothetical protein COB35_09510 [Gammaproteobacteria bacterium]|nr:MAG: hypothetical protein COB35_09510 [Gammaproteobacteria bacterium]